MHRHGRWMKREAYPTGVGIEASLADHRRVGHIPGRDNDLPWLSLVSSRTRIGRSASNAGSSQRGGARAHLRAAARNEGGSSTGSKAHRRGRRSSSGGRGRRRCQCSRHLHKLPVAQNPKIPSQDLATIELIPQTRLRNEMERAILAMRPQKLRIRRSWSA